MNISAEVRFLNFFRQVWMLPGLESWLAGRTLGKTPNHPWSKLVPNPYQYTPGSIRSINRYGVRLQVDISDYIGHYVYFGFADRSHRALFSLCTVSSRVLDVGANIGWTALRMAAIAREGHVMGFEPDSLNFDQCQSNVKLSAMKNIEIYPLALGDRPGSVLMEVRTQSNRGANRIAPEGVGVGKMVEVIRLDDFLTTRPVDQLDLIKIDVEGFELHVLRGAESTLRRFKPTLFIEVDDSYLRDQGDSALLLLQYLEDLGYTGITDAETSKPVTKDLNFEGCHIDIIAR